MISKLAYVHPDAKLGNNVTVEPFACIAGDTPPPRSRACPRT